MQTITHKLTDVARQIAESEERIDEQLQRLRTNRRIPFSSRHLDAAKVGTRALRAEDIVDADIKTTTVK
jgi:hypothetical protein